MNDHAIGDFRGCAKRLVWASLFYVLPASAAFAQSIDAPENLRLGSTGSIVAVPMSWDDPMFANAANSGPITLKSGQSASNLSINDQSGDPTITCFGSCNIDHIRITTREGPRCNSGSINLSSMWIETKGQSGDHADGLQCYNPNGTGTVTVKNTTFRSYAGPTHTGYFSADNWQGNHVFENVLFWGGNFGMRINADGGSSVSLKNVYFVEGSFLYTPYAIDIPITQWENVRWVTIQDGKMVLGDQIPEPVNGGWGPNQ